jgi:hypothetical protein
MIPAIALFGAFTLCAIEPEPPQAEPTEAPVWFVGNGVRGWKVTEQSGGGTAQVVYPNESTESFPVTRLDARGGVHLYQWEPSAVETVTVVVSGPDAYLFQTVRGRTQMWQTTLTFQTAPAEWPRASFIEWMPASRLQTLTGFRSSYTLFLPGRTTQVQIRTGRNSEIQVLSGAQRGLRERLQIDSLLLGENKLMSSWTERDGTFVVLVIDRESERVFASIVPREGRARLVQGLAAADSERAK